MLHKSNFLLNPDITFLNFGSFGACPKEIFERYQSFQLELERDPVQFIAHKGLVYLQESRKALSQFINCREDDVVMVTNPSYAVNTIAKSFKLAEGDEILTTDLEYGACDKAWDFVCKNSGAKYVRSKVSLPLTNAETFVEELFAGVSPKTKLVFISHITSSTALIFPIKAVVEKAKHLGIAVFIDGAHAPAHVPLDLTDLDPEYYTGACHKWMMAPKGSSFMYIKRSLQHDIKPLVVSWGYEALFPSHSFYQDWHAMNGTRDYSAMLCVPASIEFMQKHDWLNQAKECRALVKENAQAFADLLEGEILAPLTEEFIGQMLAVQIKTDNPEKLYRTFVDEYRIEIPVMRHGDKVYLRYSINAFNTQKDIDTLFAAINDLKQREIIG